MATATKAKTLSENTEWTNKASGIAHDAIDNIAGHASKAERSIRKTAEQSGTALEQKKEQVQASATSAYKSVHTMAKKNPVATAGIAFTAGVLLTALLRRS